MVVQANQDNILRQLKEGRIAGAGISSWCSSCHSVKFPSCFALARSMACSSLRDLEQGTQGQKNSWQEPSLAAAPAFLVSSESVFSVISPLHFAVSSSFDCAF